MYYNYRISYYRIIGNITEATCGKEHNGVQYLRNIMNTTQTKELLVNMRNIMDTTWDKRVCNIKKHNEHHVKRSIHEKHNQYNLRKINT